MIQREPSFDTHAVYKKYRENGYTDEQATAAVEVLKIEFDKLASKDDLRFMLESLNGRFDAIDIKFQMIDVKFDAVNAKFDAMNAKFDAVNSRINVLTWSIGIMCTVFIVPVITLVITHWVK